MQEQHDIAVALQIKELEIRDRDADALVTAAQGEGAGDAEEKSAALFYVRRGGAWMRAERARHARAIVLPCIACQAMPRVRRPY